MAAKKKQSTQKAQKEVASSVAKFPYTNKPSSLRRLLKEIPKKPRPAKIDQTLMKSWGFSDNNDMTVLRVLKLVGLLSEKNEPTEIYSRYMNLDEGGKILGPEIRKLYGPLFEASLTPYNEGADKLQNLFNIHSGGGERSLELQIQTFKALCENASFDPVSPIAGAKSAQGFANVTSGGSAIDQTGSSTTPVVHINLHIHLPENKTRRDYEDIIEDIGRYIFGRVSAPND